MKKFALPFLFLALLFVMMNSSFAESMNGWVEVTAGSSPFVYSDELLMVDEHSLDPDVAKMSAALAAAAYSSSTTRSMLSQMGFTTIESFYGANFSLTDNDRVYYTIAQKRYGDYTIYCIPIRGTQHAMEWVSNFNMGPTNGYHTGFKAASDDVWNNLMSMINSDGSSSDKRIIWVTGHSRGAAVANILAGRLTAAGKGHVFGYTFACPNVYYGSAPAYSNIYNFNFANDIVPQVPLTSWGYTRYGRDGTKDISSWASDMMPKAEMDALISALGTLSPGSNESKLVFGLLSWAMIDGDASSLRTLLSDFTDDPDGLIFLITNGYGLGDDTAYFRADYLNMLTFWKENQQTMSEIAAEEWMAYRSSEENAAVFALYDTVAGSTVTSYAQLESLIPTIRERNTAANDLVSVSDIMDVLFDANWSLKGLIKNPFKAHSSGYYTQWMNQDYFGYRGRAGRTYENTEIVINARTVSPQCFDGTSGCFTINIESVDAIASEAFVNCSGLTAVNITGNEDYIGYKAFSNCSGLKTVKLPVDYTYRHYFVGSAVETIIYTPGFSGIMTDRSESGGTDWFCNMLEYDVRDSLRCIEFQEGVTHIASNLCYGTSNVGPFTHKCEKLETIVLPSTLESIGNSAFRGCEALITVDLPESLVSIGEYCFESCTSLPAITISKNLTEIPAYAFSGCKSLTNLSFPHTLTSLGSYAFSNCTGLTYITIPETMQSVRGHAFSGCTGLKMLTLPANGVTYYNCFSGCTNVETIVYTPGNAGAMTDRNESGGTNWFCIMPEYDVRDSLRCIEFQEGVTHIASNLCYGTSNVGPFTHKCEKLETIILPSTLESIGNYAFYNCSALQYVILPENLTSLGEYCFAKCSSITEMMFPKRITSINGYAFSGCEKLSDITFMHTVDDSLTIGSRALYVSNMVKTTLHIPDASNMNQAIAEYGWIDSNRNVSFATITDTGVSITMGNDAVSINTPILLSVNGLPDDMDICNLIWAVDDESVAQVTSEGILTFSRAGYVTVYVAVADTDLQAELTVECEGTAIIKLPETLTLVEQEAFMGVAAEIAIIPASVQQIDSRAFSNCPNLYKVVVQNSDTIIADDAFDGSTYATVLVDGEKTE